MLYTVFETPTFTKTAETILTDEEKFDFINWISANPLSGVVIPGTGGLSKRLEGYDMNKKKYSNDEELNAFCQDLLQSVKEMKDKEYSNRTSVTRLDVSSIRDRTGLSQRNFALLLGVSPRTLQAWEQGVRNPSGAARTLLILTDKNPKILQELY